MRAVKLVASFWWPASAPCTLTSDTQRLQSTRAQECASLGDPGGLL